MPAAQTCVAVLGDGDSDSDGLRSAIAAVPGTAGPFAARQRLQRLHPRLVHAILGLGQLPGASVPDLAHSTGAVPPKWTVLDLFLLWRDWDGAAPGRCGVAGGGGGGFPAGAALRVLGRAGA